MVNRIEAKFNDIKDLDYITENIKTAEKEGKPDGLQTNNQK